MLFGGPPVGAGPAYELGYVGIWVRLIAALIDFVILEVVLVVTSFVFGGFASQDAVIEDGADTWLDWLGYAISLGYAIIFIAVIGSFWVIHEPRKQSWRDKLASTFVVRVPRGKAAA